MATCNLKMSDECYGCPYYGIGDIEGCELTIKFHTNFPSHSDEEYEKYMLNAGRVKIDKKYAK